MDESTAVLDQDTSAVVADTSADTGSIDTTVQETPAVVEQPTPMDNNVTYDNLPQEDVTYDPNKDFSQNLISEAVATSNETNANSNAGSAINKFLTKDYNYNPDEAGSYWVAGAINDKDTQMMFLDTIIQEEMYDDMELQKYYYDQTMATARAYAAQKDRETAYGFYKAAQEKAIAEAQLTGWYMPAEGQYLLANYVAAQSKLEDPNATAVEKAKAQNVSKVAEQWFNANQITTRGMKCLSMMNYEETVRHNTIMGKLLQQAQNIADSQNGIAAATAKLNLRKFKFYLEDMEMKTGHDYTYELGLDDKQFLGHDIRNDEYSKYQALEGYGSLEELLSNPRHYATVYGQHNKEWIDNALKGKVDSKGNPVDSQTYYNGYLSDLGDQGLAKSVYDNGDILADSYLNKETWKVGPNEAEGKNKEIYTFHSTEADGTPVTRCYWKDNNGVFHQITDPNMSIDKDRKISDVVKNFSGNDLTYEGRYINVGNNFNYGNLEGSNTKNKNHIKYTTGQSKTVEEKEAQGYHIVDGTFSTKNLNTNCVMSKEEDGVTKYYEVEKDGTWHELKDMSAARELTITASEGTVISESNNRGHLKISGKYLQEKDLDGQIHNDGLFTLDRSSIIEDNLEALSSNSKGTMNANTDTVYIYRNPDGSVKYLYEHKYTKDRREHKELTVVSEAKAMELTGNSQQILNRINTNRYDYNQGYKKIVEGKNQVQMAQDQMNVSSGTSSVARNMGYSDISSGTSAVARSVNSGNISTGASTVAKSVSSSDAKLQAEYKEYVRREEEEPKPEIKPFRDWLKERSATINDINAKEE